MSIRAFRENIENFPSNQTAQDMLDMVTKGWYEKSYIGKWIFQVMGVEMEEAQLLFDELRLQVFPETTTWGIAYHEQKYGMESNSGLDMDVRRSEIIKMRDSKLPMNPARLEDSILQNFKRKVTVDENIKPYTFLLYIQSNHEVELNLSDLQKYIDIVKPSHISYIPALDRAEKITLKHSSKSYNVVFPKCGEINAGMYPITGLPL